MELKMTLVLFRKPNKMGLPPYIKSAKTKRKEKQNKKQGHSNEEHS